MIGRTEMMLKLFERVRAAARIAGAVLVTGETGTGKELVARSIHGLSERAQGKFVAVDCGALPEELIESELFGHRRGAFTSAVSDKPGLFEEANGGTLFLDEIGNTSKRFQVKLLRALQERQIRRLGDLIPRKVDIRVIAATNSDLISMVRRGDFREDLYYRINVFPIHVPPLRRRTDDIPLLVEHLVRGRKTFSEGAIRKLQSYSFPGNVRELENIVESALYSVVGDVIDAPDVVLPSDSRFEDKCDIRIDNFWESVARPFSNRQITRNHVESLIRQGLAQTNGSYRKLMAHFKIPETDYKRFMDFLRRHRCNVDYRQYRKHNDE
jgi:transcriptional regulator with GAF, ATPase, and Fis domain